MCRSSPLTLCLHLFFFSWKHLFLFLCHSKLRMWFRFSILFFGCVSIFTWVVFVSKMDKCFGIMNIAKNKLCLSHLVKEYFLILMSELMIFKICQDLIKLSISMVNWVYVLLKEKIFFYSFPESNGFNFHLENHIVFQLNSRLVLKEVMLYSWIWERQHMGGCLTPECLHLLSAMHIAVTDKNILCTFWNPERRQFNEYKLAIKLP